jgi:hypothetical protein
MLSLGSLDAQLADEVAELLVELATDELLPVRLAALRGLVTWADQHKQRRDAAKQQQQQQQQEEGQQMEVDQAPAAQQQLQQQQQQEEQAEVQADDDGGDEDDDDEEGLIGEGPELPQAAADVHKQDNPQRQQQQEQPGHISRPGTPAGAAASHSVSASASSAPSAAKKPSKPSKKRKGDLPPWGTDSLAAGIAALRDSHVQVRSLALQLLVLLPPASMQAIMRLLQGLISCCEQHQQQHWQAALAVVHQLAQQRTAMVAKSCQNICKLLARAVQGPAPSAVGASHQTKQQALMVAAPPAAAAAAHSSVALELLSELILTTAKLKASMLPALQQQLEKAGLLQAAPLQPLLAQLEDMRQKRMAALQQHQYQQQQQQQQQQC